MFRTIAGKIKKDDDYPDRQYTVDVYTRVLEGAFYDHLQFGFHREKTERNGEYIPLRDRRPSVRYNVCRLVVDDSVSLLFSEGHFPTGDCDDETLKESLVSLIKDTGLNEVMLSAATIGSVGSVAIWMRVLKQDDGSHRVFYSAHRTRFLTPTFDPAAPDKLVRLREQYKVRGGLLRSQGYAIKDDDLNAEFWFARDWDADAEIWYLPWKVKGTPETATMAAASGDVLPWTVDPTKGVKHRLGFVPWVWVRNLPGDLKLLDPEGGSLDFSDIDGVSTFSGALDDMVEIDYLLSQAGRGLKYNMDPILLLKEPVKGDGAIEKGGSVIVADEHGDGKMIEINGSAFSVVLEFIKAVREFALEQMHGNRADPTKLSAAQSGRAMELMNQCLVWLADRLRVSYGEGALLSLLNMAVKAHELFPLTVAGEKLPKLNADEKISLIWPNWYPPTAQDRQSIATTLKLHKDAGHISRETAVKTIAQDYDIEDVAAEVARIEADEKAVLDALVATTQAQSKVTTVV